MKDFALIFRNEAGNEAKVTPELFATLLTDWQNWVGGIASQGKLTSPGSRLGFDGRSIKPGNTVATGPYAEIKETLRGFHIVKTDSMDEAIEIAKGCPILTIGGSVEVRDIIPMNAE
jgi:hypothetical protein